VHTETSHTSSGKATASLQWPRDIAAMASGVGMGVVYQTGVGEATVGGSKRVIGDPDVRLESTWHGRRLAIRRLTD
jgi:hypothetical protein